MSFAHWGGDDIRIIGDIVVGSLLAGAVRLVIVKAVFEPVAIWIGQMACRKIDDAVGDRLPDLLRGDQ